MKFRCADLFCGAGGAAMGIYRAGFIVAKSILQTSIGFERKCVVCENYCGKPSCIDLFCGAGGATKGLQRAGFCVLGVDNKPQKNYCGNKFHLGDALDADLNGFDFVWASPPCQRYSIAAAHMRNKGKQYPDLIGTTRAKLVASGLLYVIENVPGAPIRPDAILCGSMFGLCLVRHRLFETNFPDLILTPPCQHDEIPVTVCGHGTPSSIQKRLAAKGRKSFTSQEKRDAMGISWTNRRELSQAVPPVYSEFLGRIIMRHLTLRAERIP